MYKSSNVLVAGNAIKLIDFGIARHAGICREEKEHRIISLGTPGCASPEQLRGESVTTSTDIYSLGLLLSGLLTGVSGSGRDILDSTPFSDLPGELCATLLKAVHEDPRKRHKSALVFADDLSHFIAGYESLAGFSYGRDCRSQTLGEVAGGKGNG